MSEHRTAKAADGAAGSGRKARVSHTRVASLARAPSALDGLARTLATTLRGAAIAAEMLRDGDFDAGALADDLEAYRARIVAELDAAVDAARRCP